MSTTSLFSAVANASANLRAILLTGDFFLGAVVANTQTKLMLRYVEVQTVITAVNQAEAEVLCP